MKSSILLLILVVSLVLFTQGTALFVQYRVDKKYKVINYWVIGTGLMALGFLLMPLVVVENLRLFAVVSNPFFILGLLLLYVGLTKFLKRKLKKRVPVFIFILFCLAYFYFLFVQNNLSVRTVILCGVISFISFMMAGLLFREKEKSLLISSNFTAIIFTCYGGFYLVRAVVTIIEPPAVTYADQRIGLVVTLIISIVASNLWTFALIVMINQRLNIEKQLEQEKLQLIFNTSIDAQLITRFDDGFIVDVNDEFEHLCGFSKEEVIGKTGKDIMFWRNQEDRNLVIKELEDKGICENMEFVFQRKDGSQFAGILSAKNIIINSYPHIISAIRDITQRKLIELQMQELVEQLEKERNIAQHNAITDSLTGLFNRRYLDKKLREEFSRLMVPGEKLSLIMLDIDYFKKFNDIYGHLLGDDCLQRVASSLEAVAKGEHNIVARFGGEEFIMVLPQMDEKAVKELGEESRKAIEKLAIPHNGSDISKYVTISVGVFTVYPYDLESTDRALKIVDDALYLAKTQGRNRCIVGE